MILTALGLPVTLDDIKTAVAWEQRSVTVFGKTYPQPRLTKWYGDVPYLYSGLSWAPAPMPALVQEIRARVEALTGESFNCCLANLYRDGRDSVGWHADDEAVFGPDPVVASVSFGASRSFKLRHNTSGETQSVDLADGSLLVMPRGTQLDWKHCIPKTARPVGPRVNLTFRCTQG